MLCYDKPQQIDWFLRLVLRRDKPNRAFGWLWRHREFAQGIKNLA